MLEMLFPCVTINQDIIEEHKDELPQKWVKDVVHKALKCGRSICETKWHYQKFIMTFMCAKSGFRNIFILESDLMVPRAKVKLGEVHGPM